MPEIDAWLEQLMAIKEPEAQRAYLDQHAFQLDAEQAARRLKEQADQSLRADVQHSLQTSALLLHLADLTGSPRPRALGLLAEANVRSIGLGEYEAALRLYDQATEIYSQAGLRVEQAVSQIGKIGALTFIGRYREALDTGEWAGQILEEAEEWFSLAKMVGNMAIVNYRLGDDQATLAAFERAQRLYERAGLGDSPGWLRAEFNRAIVLRNLGQFDASIQASLNAQQKLLELEQPVEAARARQNLAMTYFVLGRYNEALENLEQVRAAFLADGRQRDAILTELFTSDCLLQLRRFSDVLEKCQTVRKVFTQLGTRFEVGLAVLNEAMAYSGLKRYEDALASLHEAGGMFEQQGNPTWAAYASLEAAGVLLRMGNPVESLQMAEDCLQRLESQPVKWGQACLAAARALLALGRTEQAEAFIQKAMRVSQENQVPVLAYAAHNAFGMLAEEHGDLQRAMAEYEQAIQYLESLRGRLMVEFRADFLEDKQEVYENMVSLHVQAGQASVALEYAERAKSRALFELLAHRLDLRLAALEPGDQQLARELLRLRSERDRLYLRWESTVNEEMHLRGGTSFETELHQVQSEVLAIEKQITSLWHKLLIRNAAYARDASLWQVRTEPIQPYLDEDTLLMEYYFSRGEWILFLISQSQVRARRLQASSGRLQQLMQLLWLNWKVVAGGAVEESTSMIRNAQGILQQLYQLLLAPVRESLASFRKVIIVPHGVLHYLPFHALHNGQAYLIETHQVSYLPAASFLRYCREVQPSDGGMLVVGSSYQGRLAYTRQEARDIAGLWGAQLLEEGQATLARIQDLAPGRRLLHLATHGDFRADNPLFSGLAFSDGWLTTLDIFNLRLNASLVTLSACETGRSVVSGGDELLGLMRAFLYAGAASLLLSQWAVNDHSSALLMQAFYRHLQEGATKGQALQSAQLSFLPGQELARPDLPDAYAHPYHWAPFFLVGDDGPI
ncbi:MAG TPA: CHAT domain-containing protein [Anaerolineales bacterium]|nr:CHAT domain-containing protein [Anaerolineales bacterium]